MEAAWDDLRTQVSGKATETPSTPASPSPLPRKARLTRSATLPAIEGGEGEREPTTPASRKGKKRASSPAVSPHPPAMPELVVTALQLVVPPEKESALAGVARTNTNVAAIASSLVSLRSDVAGARTRHLNDTRRLAGDISSTLAAQDQQSIAISALDSRVASVDAAVSRVQSEVNDLRDLAAGFDYTHDGAPHDIVAVNRHVGIVRNDLDAVRNAAQTEFTNVNGRHNTLHSLVLQLEQRLSIAEGKITVLADGKGRAEARCGEVEKKNSKLELNLLQVREAIAKLEKEAAGTALAAHPAAPSSLAFAPHPQPSTRPFSFGATPPSPATPPPASAFPPAHTHDAPAQSDGGLKRAAPSAPSPAQKRIRLDPEQKRAFHAHPFIVAIHPVSEGASANSPQALFRLYVKHVLTPFKYQPPEFHAQISKEDSATLLVGFKRARDAEGFVNAWTARNTGVLKDTTASLVGRPTSQNNHASGPLRSGPANVASSSRATLDGSRDDELMSLVAHPRDFQ